MRITHRETLERGPIFQLPKLQKLPKLSRKQFMATIFTKFMSKSRPLVTAGSYTYLLLSVVIIVISCMLSVDGSRCRQAHEQHEPADNNGQSGGGLTPDFYAATCPQLPDIVYERMQLAVQKEVRMAASVLRLQFHDCFVQGCDGSILLDDTPTFQGEKTAGPNNNSVRGFDVIDDIKSNVEQACPGVVSCADILSLAARDGVFLLNGPIWEVPLGRRDSTTASLNGANTQIPAPNSTLSTLISMFGAKGLSTLDLVVLSGAHTIGLARCVSFRQRLYNQAGTGLQDPTLETSFAGQLAAACPQVGGDNNLSQLDLVSPTVFDAQYYNNLLAGKGLLASDQVLASSSSSSSSITQDFAQSQSDFFENFKQSMVKLSSIGVLTGSNGEIRTNCRKVNS